MPYKKPLFSLLILAVLGTAIILARPVWQSVVQRQCSTMKFISDPKAGPPVPNQPSQLNTQLYPSVAQTPDHGRAILKIGTTQLIVEVVNTAASVTQGLSDRAELGADGMLFVFQQSMMPRFWMKEMQFPLDLIWINKKKIVDITHNAPAPDPTTPLSELPTYAPSAPVDWVLEVPASTAAQLRWEVGMPVLELEK